MQTQFYDDQYSMAYPEGIENHWWHIARNRIITDVLKPLLSKNDAVIEVGCGRGNVVKHLRDNGFDCHGVELSHPPPPFYAEGYIKFGLRAEDLPVSERNQFKALLLLDVIEHIPNPNRFLATLQEAFPSLEHIVITVPAREELWSNYDEFYGHVQRYDLEQIEALCSYNSFRPIRLGYFFHMLYYPTRLMLALRKQRSLKTTAPQGAMKILSKVIAFLGIVDYYLLSPTLAGTSVLCVADVTKNRADTG